MNIQLLIADMVTATPDTAAPVDVGRGFFARFGSVLQEAVRQVGQNGYNTAIALIVLTMALVIGLNMRANPVVLTIVGIGSFWGGWLTWNTFTGENHSLFGSEVSATKLWDVAIASETGFLVFSIVVCATVLFLWRKSTKMATRIGFLIAAVLGASFIYNLVESVKVA